MSSSLSLLDLPQDILVTIFKKLHVTDLRNLMLTCNYLKNLLENDNSLWRYVFKHFLVINFATKRLDDSLRWYDKCRISHNWRSGIYRDRVAINHNEKYMPWLRFSDPDHLLLTVGSELRCYAHDKKKGIGAPLWRVEVPKVERCDVRTNDISRFAVASDIVACANRDGCTAVYKIDPTGKERPRPWVHIRDCHDSGYVEVSAVEIVHGEPTFIITASNNERRCKLWRLTQDGVISLRNRHLHNSNYLIDGNIEIANVVGLRCLSIDNDQSKLVIGPNGNCTPVLLDLETYQIILNTNEPANSRQAIRDIEWHDSHSVIYSTHSGKLIAVDTRIGKNVYEAADPFMSPLYCVRSDHERAVMCGAAEYARCVLFDLRRPMLHVQTYFTQKKSSPIYSLEFDQCKLIAAADRSVAVLNYNVSVGAARRRDYSQAFQVVQR